MNVPKWALLGKLSGGSQKNRLIKKMEVGRAMSLYGNPVWKISFHYARCCPMLMRQIRSTRNKIRFFGLFFSTSLFCWSFWPVWLSSWPFWLVSPVTWTEIHLCAKNSTSMMRQVRHILYYAWYTPPPKKIICTFMLLCQTRPVQNHRLLIFFCSSSVFPLLWRQEIGMHKIGCLRLILTLPQQAWN